MTQRVAGLNTSFMLGVGLCSLLRLCSCFTCVCHCFAHASLIRFGFAIQESTRDGRFRGGRGNQSIPLDTAHMDRFRPGLED
jgi:hypothetical protein